MNAALTLAASGLAVVGLVHSVLGELLVFRPLRMRGRAPTGEGPPLREWQVRILWGTWHLATVLGWALGALLWHLAGGANGTPLNAWAVDVAGFATLAGGLLVFFATRGHHPGWLALMGVAALVWWH